MQQAIVLKTPSATIKVARRKDNVLSLRYPNGREVVSSVEEIRHPVIREVLALSNFRGGLDLTASSAAATKEDLDVALRALDGGLLNGANE
ncbi:MAG: hypothetical protein Q8L24_00090 [bacterium]|nr:hypothetical protein [bacterium]